MVNNIRLKTAANNGLLSIPTNSRPQTPRTAARQEANR